MHSAAQLTECSSGEMDSDLEEQLLASVYYSKHFELEQEVGDLEEVGDLQVDQVQQDQEAEDGEISKYTIQSRNTSSNLHLFTQI